MLTEIEILTIEVGSTITKVNGFALAEGGGFDHVAQGFAPTSVAQGDVGVGVQQAIGDLESRYGAPIGKPETFVNSSAAGGLRMTVHGLTYSMTARAAREAWTRFRRSWPARRSPEARSRVAPSTPSSVR